ncbi:MAG: hypothetical protein [Caudoviricetes sp.]|nr:MAG: hypothetical protein [Caudoviricetes sp.]
MLGYLYPLVVKRVDESPSLSCVHASPLAEPHIRGTWITYNMLISRLLIAAAVIKKLVLFTTVCTCKPRHQIIRRNLTGCLDQIVEQLQVVCTCRAGNLKLTNNLTRTLTRNKEASRHSCINSCLVDVPFAQLEELFVLIFSEHRVVWTTRNVTNHECEECNFLIICHCVLLKQERASRSQPLVSPT